MIRVRPAAARGRTTLDWLDSAHTFSFGEYFDPAHMGFRTLRVINDDLIAAGGGFGTHGHRDMEILSFVFAGALAHKDSLGHGETVRPDDVQRMTAGSGILHSEFNPSKSEATRLLQVWILPERRGLTPGYEQRSFPDARGAAEPTLVASGEPRDGALRVHQDVAVYRGRPAAGASYAHAIARGRGVWIQVAAGELVVGGKTLVDGDGAAVEQEASVALVAKTDAEYLLFDLG